MREGASLTRYGVSVSTVITPGHPVMPGLHTAAPVMASISQCWSPAVAPVALVVVVVP